MSLRDAISRAAHTAAVTPPPLPVGVVVSPGGPAAMNLRLALSRAGFNLRGEDGRRGVGHSRDLDRIIALPLQGTYERPDFHLVVRKPEGALRRGDPVIPVELKDVQAEALWQASQAAGLVGFIGAGWGKTGIALLLPTVFNSQRAVIVTRTQLRGQLIDDMRRWSVNFRVRADVIHIVTYEDLSREGTADVLDRIAPDLVVADEAHRLRHRSAARTKRFLRYFGEHESARLCVMSGTLSTGSIRDYAHLAAIALRERSPLPLHYPALVEWAQAVDPPARGATPLAPGALRALCRDDREPVRLGFRRRLTLSVGVVATDDGALDTSLVIRGRTLEAPAEVRAALTRLEATWCRPDGEELQEALELHRVGVQLSAGFFYRWVWPDGVVDEEWMEARRGWHRAVRHRLRTNSRPGLDSPLLLARAAVRGEWDCPEWALWDRVRHRQAPPTEAVWVDDYALRDAVAWGREAPGIIWYAHTVVGERIAAMGDFPFVGAGPEASAEIVRLSRTAPTIVASTAAHGEGKNLQAWSRSLVFQLPGNASGWEQLLARLHRPHQTADFVDFEVYQTTEYHRKALGKAFSEARYLEETTGNRQRLLYAVREGIEVADDEAPTPGAEG